MKLQDIACLIGIRVVEFWGRKSGEWIDGGVLEQLVREKLESVIHVVLYAQSDY